ncbi:E3 ubiquitin-protein ligase TRIM35-like [Hoplias malabaricus]|uniref:E3 ubiquitin-protein ligase TRIM35-like n=1 Tax=Hoplias malabaricus TaxID=27720 RepID=UPI0034637200
MSEEECTCPVCSQIFREPLLLLCKHNACKTCLHEVWEATESRECPVCKRRSSKEYPPINLHLQKMCQTFSESQTLRSVGICSVHNGQLTLFCFIDYQPVCVHCQASEIHQNHDCHSIDDTLTDLKNKLKDALEPLEMNLNILKEVKQDYDQTAAYIKTQAQHIERQIKEQFERLHQFLRDEETASIAALKEEEKQKSDMIKKRIEEMTGEISILTDTIRSIQKEMEAEDISFLQLQENLHFNYIREPFNCHLGLPRLFMSKRIKDVNGTLR